MQVKYGSYTHDTGEVALSVNKSALFNEAGVHYATQEVWNLQGVISASSAANVDSAVASLVSAYATHGQDLVLLLPDTSNSQLLLDSSACNGGTKVTQPPSFPDMRGAGYACYLPYAITVEGEVEVTSRETGNILSFTESVSRSGGGPRYAVRETVEGIPIRQRVRNATAYVATQSGSATGLYGYPSPPAPLWPFALVEAGQFSFEQPRRRASGRTAKNYTEWTVTWSYRYESPTPILGGPNIWGLTI